MAKTQGQVTDDWDSHGRFAGKVESRKVRRAREVDFPVTVVDTAWKRFKRAAVG
jgi:hypothetical protein